MALLQSRRNAQAHGEPPRLSATGGRRPELPQASSSIRSAASGNVPAPGRSAAPSGTGRTRADRCSCSWRRSECCRERPPLRGPPPRWLACGPPRWPWHALRQQDGGDDGPFQGAEVLGGDIAVRALADVVVQPRRTDAVPARIPPAEQPGALTAFGLGLPDERGQFRVDDGRHPLLAALRREGQRVSAPSTVACRQSRVVSPRLLFVCRYSSLPTLSEPRSRIRNPAARIRRSGKPSSRRSFVTARRAPGREAARVGVLSNLA